ncbi:glycosyltransferase family 2 protein [Pseudalkalibacillus sp. Hm43]|uniref:glycosyltransferase family 2 protein n=1 Tax=Pseudalkalibacillus sp. Hm43 TaxID=3450742 RepID=UPI003F4278FA
MSDLAKKEISVIIPTYNKYPQNLLTLYSLQYQSFDLSKVEVIMIDDGSTDDTYQQLNKQTFPFQFKLIRCEKNIGRPAARNLGLRAASGKIIIFLDAEILVQDDFLKIHHEYHQQHPNLVVTGIMFLKRLYSVLDPSFSPEQLEECMKLVRRRKSMRSKVSEFMKSPRIMPLLSENEIRTRSFANLVLPTHFELLYEYTIIKNYGYGLEGYHIPWQLFGTGHVSVSKKAIDKVGLFAEYPGYGWDDCEMGYRLYKNGATYISDGRLISYHQEHPRAVIIQDESKQNYYRFQETYKAVDQMIISLSFLPDAPFNLHQVNQILINYQDLCKSQPGQFRMIKRVFHIMLRRIGLLRSQNKNISKLMPCTMKPSEYEQLKVEKEQLRKLVKYTVFLNCFEHLASI